MRVMVCGSRDWSDVDAVTLRLLELPSDAYLLHGAASGADQIASEAAASIGIPQRAFPPDYTRPSPQRYHERNDQMLARADLVLAFWDGKSRGTKSVIEKAKERGVPVEVIS